MKIRKIFPLLLLFVFGVTACQNTSSSSSTTSSESSSLTSETSVSSSSASEGVTPTGLLVTYEGEQVYQLEVLVGEEKTLVAIVLPEGAKAGVSWVSTDTSVAAVSEAGVLTGIGQGETIITATSQHNPLVDYNFFVSVKLPVMQTGVGSGLTPQDPIFQGNEGDDAPVEVHIFETFHIYADAILIKKGNIEILIDGGWAYDGEMNKPIYDELIADKRIDMVIASHSHEDHYDAIPGIIEGYEISTVLDYGRTTARPAYKQAIQPHLDAGTHYYGALDSIQGTNGAEKRYYFTNEFYVEVLDTANYVTADYSSAQNQHSLALLFVYKDFTFFTAGDLTTSSEQAMLRTERNLPQNISLYKASHHASHGSNHQELLNHFNPYMVTVPATRAGQFNVQPGAPSPTRTYNLNGASGHPAKEAIERIYKAPRISQNLNVYWNMPNGHTTFTTYGGATDVVQAGSETRHGYFDLTLTDGVPVWNENLQNFENKVTGEENAKLHETKVFLFRDYVDILPQWAQDEYFAD
ncbi:MAG TPA: Ig-like domain-containing protein [Bacilli bacterium]|nr:Ig-like domain-containing protein [Bacilli bacterium]